MNPFLPAWSAARYAEHRPRIHEAMLAPFREAHAGALPVERALDLGCGTGLSSIALARLAQEVVAFDVSLPMLGVAAADPCVSYVAARAEAIPLASARFDLATLGCALHWCEPEALFAELHRVLREAARVVVYDNGFRGEMKGSEPASAWLEQDYPARYPAPPRHRAFRPEEAPAGFATEDAGFVEVPVSLGCEALVRYLTTQSNVIDAVESGRETLAQVEDHLRTSLAPFFAALGAERAEFLFAGRYTVLARR